MRFEVRYPTGAQHEVELSGSVAVLGRDPDLFEGIGVGRYPAPFMADAVLYPLPEAPDFLEAGDFDADGHADVVSAARGSRTIYLSAGDGRGRLSNPRAMELSGRVTAMRAPCRPATRCDRTWSMPSVRSPGRPASRPSPC